jgi:hypothetical protein
MQSLTFRYVRADIDLERQALLQAFPEVLAPPRADRLLFKGTKLLDWFTEAVIRYVE